MLRYSNNSKKIAIVFKLLLMSILCCFKYIESVRLRTVFVHLRAGFPALISRDTGRV